MARRRRKKIKRLKAIKWIRNGLLFIFFLAVTAKLFNIISGDNTNAFLIGSAIGLIILYVFGWLTPKHIGKRIKAELGFG